MNTPLKIFIATSLAPLAPFVILTLFAFASLPFVYFLSSEPITFIDVLQSISFAAFSLIISYPATIIIGVPTHLLLRLINRNTVKFHAIAGCVYGMVIAFLIAISRWQEEEGAALVGTIFFGIIFLICTVSVSTTFGIIANSKRLSGDINAAA